MPDAVADVLIITALRSELLAVLTACGARREDWDEGYAKPFRYHLRTHSPPGANHSATFAVARALEMGEVSAASCAVRLVQHLRPRMLAMCGVCAGRRGEVALGDVIVADRIFKFDSGATVSSVAGAPEYTVQLFGDVRTYNLKVDWKYAVEEFGDNWHERIGDRPLSVEEEEAWFLCEMKCAEQPPNPAKLNPPNKKRWPLLLDRLRRKELIDHHGQLTEEGDRRASFEVLRSLHGERQTKPKVHLGAIGTSARLQRDVHLFDRLALILRKTLGVEMEGSALGAVAEMEGLDMIMAKGVMDHGDPEKDDAFKEYAAKAAAEFLFAFLFERASPVESDVPTRPVPPALPPPGDGGIGVGDRSVRPAAGAVDIGQAGKGETPATSKAVGARHGFRWLLLLDQNANELFVAAALRSLGADLDSDVVATDEPGVFSVSSAMTLFEAVREQVRQGQTVRVGAARVLYVCRDIVTGGDDPLEGKYGRIPRRRGFVLGAEVVGEDDDSFEVALSVRSVDPSQRLMGTVTFHLPDSFQPPAMQVSAHSGYARTRITARRSFTIGAIVTDPETRLELNLANVAGVPRRFLPARPEEIFVRAVVDMLQERGQAATQFITAQLDDDAARSPDIVFSPNDPASRLVCVEVKRSAAPTLGEAFLARAVEHRRAIEAATPGAVYALATDAKLSGPAAAAMQKEGLLVVPFDWADPAGLAFAIEVLSLPNTSSAKLFTDQPSVLKAMADPSTSVVAVSTVVWLTRRQVEGWVVIYGLQVDGQPAMLLVRRP